MKSKLWQAALCAVALFSLSFAGHAQAPAASGSPATATSGAAADTASAALTSKTIAADPTITKLNGASLTAEGASRGDTAWMIVATALVMLMTPGLAFFYGGLVRSKNVLNTLMMSFAALGIISIQWMLWGYSVAFGPTPVNGPLHLIIASPLSWMGLRAGQGRLPFPMPRPFPARFSCCSR